MVEVGPLAVADRDAGGSSAAEAEDRGHAIACIEPKLILDMLLGIERRV